MPIAFVIFDAVSGALLALAVCSFVRLLRERRRPLRRGLWSVLASVVLPMLWELLLPAGLLTLLVLPLIGPLPLMLMAAPDLTWWLLALSLVLIVTGGTRIFFAVGKLRQPAHSMPDVPMPGTATELSRGEPARSSADKPLFGTRRSRPNFL